MGKKSANAVRCVKECNEKKNAFHTKSVQAGNPAEKSIDLSSFLLNYVK